MAVVTAEAAGGKAAAGTGIRLPSVSVPHVGLAPATLGLLGSVLIGAGIAGAMALEELLPRILALVSVVAGGYLVGRAGIAPPPNDDDLARRDTLLRARERALVEREAAVDGALVSLALRRDDRRDAGVEPAVELEDAVEPLPDAGQDRGARSRRPGLRPVPSSPSLDDDGVAPRGGVDEGWA